MSDHKEWYHVPGEGNFTNQESAFAAAEKAAARTDTDVVVCLCSERVIRRYRRQVSITVEDVPSPAVSEA
ncbi:hypothetical protein ACFPM3_20295 [Streptomyces coeruleoprunus]|uniref:DUF2188 domain-containing protein n=1 Tax=Streptomyces coeruleoprunus TaxID=285563 RepID=A0ABV9XJ04_9ACTN